MSNIKEYSQQDALEKMELIYLETDSGFHIALDATYIDQVGDFEIKLPTGEIINTAELKESQVQVKRTPRSKTIYMVGVRILGTSLLNLWGGGQGSIEMDARDLNLKFATKDNILRCVNDGGFGCEGIERAELDIYAIYDNGSSAYIRTIYSDTKIHQPLYLGCEHLRNVGALM